LVRIRGGLGVLGGKAPAHGCRPESVSADYADAINDYETVDTGGATLGEDERGIQGKRKAAGLPEVGNNGAGIIQIPNHRIIERRRSDWCNKAGKGAAIRDDLG